MGAVRKPSRDEFPGAEQFVPAQRSLAVLREAANTCRGCPLYRAATQVVFGEGAETARVVMVGEQPGDSEDLIGRPFVGPAGRLLDQALVAAKIDRGQVYVTNAVKHFKYTRRGKRRIHDKPNRYEIEACHPWLEAELNVIKPEIVVVLGATAAQALLGSEFRVSRRHGEPIASPLAKWTFATVHPAAVLRAPDADSRAAAREMFFADFAVIGAHLHAR
jgi:uracil-DNA glycosylase